MRRERSRGGGEARRRPAALVPASCAVSGNGPVSADVSAVPVMERSADAREADEGGAVGREKIWGGGLEAARCRHRAVGMAGTDG